MLYFVISKPDWAKIINMYKADSMMKPAINTESRSMILPVKDFSEIPDIVGFFCKYMIETLALHKDKTYFCGSKIN